MKKNPFAQPGFKTEGFCRNDSFYVKFDYQDIVLLSQYAEELGYVIEPTESESRYKIINPITGLYGWISKVKEKVFNPRTETYEWTDGFLYGFFKNKKTFIVRYSITWNIMSKYMRGMTRVMNVNNPKSNKYFRTVFGILDLEETIHPLQFISSYVSSLKVVQA